MNKQTSKKFYFAKHVYLLFYVVNRRVYAFNFIYKAFVYCGPLEDAQLRAWSPVRKDLAIYLVRQFRELYFK